MRHQKDSCEDALTGTEATAAVEDLRERDQAQSRPVCQLRHQRDPEALGQRDLRYYL